MSTCLEKAKHQMVKAGDVFERLTVVGQAGGRRWLCRCACGNVRLVVEGDLRTGNTRSCGCLKREMLSARSTKHGAKRRSGQTPEYSSWSAMKTRCLNPNFPAYPNYGGRGIRICDRWIQSFENFVADMGERPSLAHTLERIDNNGNYEPGNCRWVTRKEQCRNKRTSVLFEYNGERLTVQDWANRFGRGFGYTYRRLFLYGLTAQEAMAELRGPVRAVPRAMKRGFVDRVRNNARTRRITVNGQTRCLTEWSEVSGIPMGVIRDRLRLGWTAERAMREPVMAQSRRRKIAL